MATRNATDTKGIRHGRPGLMSHAGLRPRPGSMAEWDPCSGGVASFDHRLQSGIPPGWRSGTCSRQWPGRFRRRVGIMPGAPGCEALREDGCRRHPSVQPVVERSATTGLCVTVSHWSWHPSPGCGHGGGRRVPVVSLRSTTGVILASLRHAAGDVFPAMGCAAWGLWPGSMFMTPGGGPG